ncbi:putative protein BCP1 [Paratrimastix pyriformis]|uniref:Uncharacterized protein n=1 Tax=Paratrimastix pyriformis TaxID=342808 RepID=A0ABQ8U8V7_9EUKA|nr:putative protein BCP1 [Paratrimastix pyriformis]
MVDFDFFPPAPQDAHDIRTLLARYLDNNVFHAMEFADLLIDQARGGQGLGTVVSANEGNVVLGVVSAIDMLAHPDLESIREIREVILQHASAAGGEQSPERVFREALEGAPKRTGLLLAERMVNVPAQLMAPMYDSLLRELTRLRAAAPGDPAYMAPPRLRCDQWIVLSRFCDLGAHGGRRKKTGRRGGEEEGYTMGAERFFLHPEDEIFYQALFMEGAKFRLDKKFHHPLTSLEQGLDEYIERQRDKTPRRPSKMERGRNDSMPENYSGSARTQEQPTYSGWKQALNELQEVMIVAPVDKAAHDLAICCRQWYLQKLRDELLNARVYQQSREAKEEIIVRHRAKAEEFQHARSKFVFPLSPEAAASALGADDGGMRLMGLCMLIDNAALRTCLQGMYAFLGCAPPPQLAGEDDAVAGPAPVATAAAAAAETHFAKPAPRTRQPSCKPKAARMAEIAQAEEKKKKKQQPAAAGPKITIHKKKDEDDEDEDEDQIKHE